jgi:hypothetical protein
MRRIYVKTYAKETYERPNEFFLDEAGWRTIWIKNEGGEDGDERKEIGVKKFGKDIMCYQIMRNRESQSSYLIFSLLGNKREFEARIGDIESMLKNVSFKEVPGLTGEASGKLRTYSEVYRLADEVFRKERENEEREKEKEGKG